MHCLKLITFGWNLERTRSRNPNRIRTHLVDSLEGTVAQSVERATLGEEVPGSIATVAARSLLVGWVSV